MVAAGGRVELRPHGQLFRQGVLACIAFMTPVFIVLYVVTVPEGPWQAVIAVHVIATITVVLAGAAYFRVVIVVDPDSVTEVGFFGSRRRVERADIGSLVRAEIFDSSGFRTLPQLFVCGPGGSQLIRMRGQFWSALSMDTVATTLKMTPQQLDEPLSTSELRREYPGLLYWFELHPVITAGLFTLATALFAGALYLLFVFVDPNL